MGVGLLRTEDLGADISTISTLITRAPNNPFLQINPDGPKMIGSYLRKSGVSGRAGAPEGGRK